MSDGMPGDFVETAKVSESSLNVLLCFYVAYQTEKGVSWRVTNTPLNLDNANDLIKWIEEEEAKENVQVAPVFWKRLET